MSVCVRFERHELGFVSKIANDRGSWPFNPQPSIDFAELHGGWPQTGKGGACSPKMNQRAIPFQHFRVGSFGYLMPTELREVKSIFVRRVHYLFSTPTEVGELGLSAFDNCGRQIWFDLEIYEIEER